MSSVNGPGGWSPSWGELIVTAAVVIGFARLVLWVAT